MRGSTGAAVVFAMVLSTPLVEAQDEPITMALIETTSRIT
jgi:hypothetical protein